MSKSKKFKFAVLLAILVVLLGLYLILSRFLTYVPREDTVDAVDAELFAQDPVLEKLEEVGASDDVSAIESDLGATDLENLDSELQTIEAGL